MSYTADAAGRRLAVVISTPTTLGDLHVLDGPAASPTKLTSFNDELFNGLTLTEPEEIWYPSFDGRRIQGWILKPPDFDPQKKYPLILQIHGGPHSAYGNTFTHEFAWMAAKGYVVLYTNPRGSSNYGQEFGNIIQFNYPGDDYKDLMAGVDAVLKKGYIDEKQMGVTGGSGGGLLTNWVVTQTTRFKAAVSQRDISDWANFWYTADFTLFTPTWFHKAPFEDPAEFARRSPITYAAKIQTPLMFILGDEDWRTPPSAGGEDLFRALKYLKRPTVMVRFPGESHELSRSGRPWHRVERLQHIVGWFDKYLTGRTTGTYEPALARSTQGPLRLAAAGPRARRLGLRSGANRLPLGGGFDPASRQPASATGRCSSGARPQDRAAGGRRADRPGQRPASPAGSDRFAGHRPPAPSPPRPCPARRAFPSRRSRPVAERTRRAAASAAPTAGVPCSSRTARPGSRRLL